MDPSVREGIKSLTALVGQTVIIAPLDWGMGHHTRCLALARILIAQQKKIIIATTVEFVPFWQSELPESIIEIIPAYQINYPVNQLAWVSVVKQLPKIISLIKKENELASALALRYRADSIISDNRFGFYAKHLVRNIYLTHQLFQQMPIVGGIANRIHYQFISKYDICLVPDYPLKNESLAGQLSHGNSQYLPPLFYIGPLSRLTLPSTTLKFDTLLLSSGPLPMRKQFTQQLNNYASVHCDEKMALITPDKFESKLPHVTVFNNPDTATLSALFYGAKHCVSRSGYSTLMDIHQAGVSQQTFIPTQGQPEQHYLAQYWHQQFGSRTISQSDFENIH